MAHLFLGIDAGGTSCKGRLVTSDAHILAEYKTGPANIQLGVDVVLKELTACAKGCLKQAEIKESEISNLFVGVGMAGVSHGKELNDQLMHRHPFATLKLSSDSHIACLSAHNGQDGAIIISGTGSAGYYIQQGQGHILGGHGFMLGDQGSGAHLGYQAVRSALLAHDGLAASSPLTQNIIAQFDHNIIQMLKWSQKAKPADYAQFSLPAMEAYKQGDAIAQKLIHQSLNDLSLMINYLYNKTQKPIGIVGGLGNALKPLLIESLGEKILVCEVNALHGATLLAFQTAPF